LGELEGITSNDVASDILSKELNDVEGLGVHLHGSDEKLVAVALVVEQHLDLSHDLVSSQLVPGHVVLRLQQLLLESGSVLLSLLEQLHVQVLHLSELLNGGGANLLVGSVLLVSGILGINVLLLKISKETEDGVDGIRSLGASLEEG
jgi:hypothetical protein